MKKVLALMLALVLVLSLVACGGSSSSEEKGDGTITKAETEDSNQSTVQLKSLGNTVSTDIIDFTLNKAALTLYASSEKDDTYTEPVNTSNGDPFKASEGNVLVCMNFTFKNNSSNTLSLGKVGDSGKSALYFFIATETQKSSIDGIMFNHGSNFGLTYDASAISYDGGKSFIPNTNSYILVEEGQSITVKVVGVAELESVYNTFYVTVNMFNSDGGFEPFTYKIN